MQGVYLDNAATSYPKAPGVGEAMLHYINDVGANINRASYPPALEAASATLSLREALCKLFHSSRPECCILTPGATFGINMTLRGFLRPGDRVITSRMEHNAVMRPLRELEQRGVLIETAPCLADGTIELCSFERLLANGARAAVINHASNVCGTLMPIEEVGGLCRKYHVPLIIDAAQTAGHIEINFEQACASALIFPIHKGLLGPQGIGGEILSREFAEELLPLCSGGTGSRSNEELQPQELPDKFEAGTPNLPGIFGALAAAQFISAAGISAIREHEMALCSRFLEGLSDISGVRLLGNREPERRVGVIALDFYGLDNAEAAYEMEKNHCIMTRCGLHCAPAAHHSLGSFPSGAVRFSLGWKNTSADVDAALFAISEVIAQKVR